MELKEVSDRERTLEVRVAVLETKMEGAGKLITFLLSVMAIVVAGLALITPHLMFK